MKSIINGNITQNSQNQKPKVATSIENTPYKDRNLQEPYSKRDDDSD